MGAPSIYVYDCSNAGIIVDSFKQFAIQHEVEFEVNLTSSVFDIAKHNYIICCCFFYLNIFYTAKYLSAENGFCPSSPIVSELYPTCGLQREPSATYESGSARRPLYRLPHDTNQSCLKVVCPATHLETNAKNHPGPCR